VIPVGDDQCRFDYKKLEVEIKAIVLRKLGDEKAAMAEKIVGSKTIPTFVVATKGLNAGGPPTLFRSYECEGHNADMCAIWEAARATSAAPTFFKPITIESPLPRATYVDGGLQNNNPTELARAEAQKIWPKAKRFCIVSVGTGRLKAIQITSASGKSGRSKGSNVLKWIPGVTTASRVVAGSTSARNIAKACVDLVTNSEPVHQRLFKESNSSDPERQFPYHRFNVDRDMQDIGLQEWSKMEEMASHTAVYIEEGEGVLKRNKCVHDLMNSPNMECK
jgi:predicted acylesterase/phospholipase RssA